MGKPKGKNGFWHFMIHKQNELKRNGQNYAVNDPRLQQMAGDQWKAMSKEEKEPFDSKAKYEKEKSRNAPVIHLPPKSYAQQQHDNFNKMMSKEAEELDTEEAQQLYYEKLVEAAVKACKTREDLLNASFFVMGSNVMVRTEEKPNTWPPLEIGICQYSIQNGIQYTYHEFIDAGSVPMGYMHLSKEHAEMTHKIPFDDFSLATNNYPKIVEDIKVILDNSRFFNDYNGKPTPMMVFCREDALEQNRGIFEWLANRYAETYPGFRWDIEVLDLNFLVYNILNAIGTPLPIALIEDKLTTSAFDYSANTLCEYHEEMDNRYCARGLARALCFMMSQIFCPPLDITPTENHLPPKREGIIADQYKGVLSETRPFVRRYHADQDDNEWQPKEDEQEKEKEPQELAPAKKMGIGRGWNTWTGR